MHIPTHSSTTDLSQQLVTLHYNDGRIQDAVLRSDLLRHRTIQFVPSQPSNDRRHYPRTPFIGEVRIDQLGVRRATDLSSRGMYVECITPYAVDSIIPVCIDIGQETFCIDTRVAFIDPGIGMGLEFYRIPSSVQLKLDALVQRTVRQLGTASTMCRRRGVDRRAPEGQTKKLKLRRQMTDRRRKASPMAGPLQIEHTALKTIFFQKQPPVVNAKAIEARVEFHDGEEIQVKLLDDGPEAMGFFAEMKMLEDASHTVYIVKSAVKHVEYLF
jgi:hypothetical protein